jgi:hypothetical protein
MWRDTVNILIITALLLQTTGCALMFEDNLHTVRVVTQPNGRTVYFNGTAYNDGQTVVIDHDLETPRFNVGTPGSPRFQEIDYSVSPWLIGDGVLLVFFVIPGLVAFGVDMLSGAWRIPEDPQVVYVETGE